MRLRQFDWKCESRDSGQVHGLGAEVLCGSLSSVVNTGECRVERRRSESDGGEEQVTLTPDSQVVISDQSPDPQSLIKIFLVMLLE